MFYQIQKKEQHNSRFTVLAIISHIDPPLTGAATCCCLLCARDERWFQCAGAQTAGWTAPTIRDRYITPLSFQHSDGWLSFGILWQTSALRVDLIPSLLLSEQNISYRQRSHVLLLGVGFISSKMIINGSFCFYQKGFLEMYCQIVHMQLHVNICVTLAEEVIGLLCLSVFKQEMDGYFWRNIWPGMRLGPGNNPSHSDSDLHPYPGLGFRDLF